MDNISEAQTDIIITSHSDGVPHLSVSQEPIFMEHNEEYGDEVEVNYFIYFLNFFLLKLCFCIGYE